MGPAGSDGERGNARLRAGAGWWGRAVRRCGATWALGELACAGWAVRSGAKRETKRAVLSETGRGGAGPVSRALGRAWAERTGLLRKRAGPMRKKRATGKGWAGLGLGFGLG